MPRAMWFMVLATLLPISLFAAEMELIVSTEGNLPYEDVPAGVWYEEAIRGFFDLQYLDRSQKFFRPLDTATRAEFLKLVVELNGGILDDLPEQPTFVDVTRDDWFFPFLEEATREGWVRGDGNCVGQSSCTVRPHAIISRAEAAVLIQRAFGKQPLKLAPAFADSPTGEWFSEAVQAAADHCILRGDDASRNVRPQSTLNRAEMVVMLHRVDEGRKYPDCV